jgi:hypothetical protein
MTVARRTPGPAYANLQRRKPREVWRGRASDAMGTWRLSWPSASTAFAIWQRVTRCKKGTYYNLCVMCLTAAFVPHRPNKYFHVTASNGIVSSSPYTPLAIMTASPIASVRVFETVAMQMSSRYVRCAPNVVDDRSRDHHAERSSVPGKCFWPPIVRLKAPIVPSIAGTAMPLAAAPYRASGLVVCRACSIARK